MHFHHQELLVLLLICFLLTGCGKNLKPDATTDEASAKTPTAAKVPEQNAKLLDFYTNAAPAQPLVPKELKNGKELLKSQNLLSYGALSADGKLVYVAESNDNPNSVGTRVKCVEIASQKVVKQLPVRGAYIEKMKLSPNGAVLGLARDQGDSPGLVEIWDTAKGIRKSSFYHPHNKETLTNSIASIDISLDGKTAVSVSYYSEPGVETKTYFCWSAETGKKLWSLDTQIYMSNVRFSRDGKLVLLWSNGAAILVDAMTGETKESYPAMNHYPNIWLEFSQDEKEILVLASTKDQPSSCFARIERASGKHLLSQLTGVKGSGQILVLADGQHAALFFNTRVGKVLLLIFKIKTGDLKASYQVRSDAVEDEVFILPDGNTFLIENKVYDLSAQ